MAQNVHHQRDRLRHRQRRHQDRAYKGDGWRRSEGHDRWPSASWAVRSAVDVIEPTTGIVDENAAHHADRRSRRPIKSRRLASRASADPLARSPATAAGRCLRPAATGVDMSTQHAGRISARRSVSSPPSRSASRARSSPCVRSTPAVWRSVAPMESMVKASHDGVVNIKNRHQRPVQERRMAQRAGGAWKRNGEIVLTDEKGTRDRARYRVPYGARLLVDEGEKVKRQPDSWPSGTRTSLPILAEQAGRPLRVSRPDRHGITPGGERKGEVTGLTSKLVVELQAGEGHRPAAQAAAEGRRGRRSSRLSNYGEARYFLTSEVILSARTIEAGAPARRRAGPHPARGQQDARHHRRSAPRDRVLRGEAAEGPCDHRP